MKRFLLRAWVVMTLIFLAGVATGVLLTFAARPLLGPPPAQEMRNRWMSHLVHRLKLTEEQQAKIGPILTDAQQQILTVHREDVGRISGIMQATNARISPLLDEKQQEELKKMELNRERMFGERMRRMERGELEPLPHPHGGRPPDGP